MRAGRAGQTSGQTDERTNGRPAGLTLVELLLAVMLMGLVSVVLSQTFAVGVDSYNRGRRALRGLGETRVAAHTFVDAARSMVPSSGKVKLESGNAGSSVNFIRRSRLGFEENGFGISQVSGKTKLLFRRQWPPSADVATGGNSFPLVRDISKFQVSLVLPAAHLADRWPAGVSSGDTLPSLMQFVLQDKDGRLFQSAAFMRVHPASLLIAADT